MVSPICDLRLHSHKLVCSTGAAVCTISVHLTIWSTAALPVESSAAACRALASASDLQVHIHVVYYVYEVSALRVQARPPTLGKRFASDVVLGTLDMKISTAETRIRPFSFLPLLVYMLVACHLRLTAPNC